MNHKDEFSFINGVSFTFDDGSSKIEAWFSAFTGLEKIYVNGTLASSQRNISKSSVNEFRIGENLYSVNVQAVNLLNGPFTCTLVKNGINLNRKKLVFSKPNYILVFAIIILTGLVVEFINSIFDPPKIIFYFVHLVCFIGIVIFVAKNRKPTIEEEKLF